MRHWFITFMAAWLPTLMASTASGRLIAYWPFDDGHSFYIIFNLAVGGWFDKPNYPPADMEPKRLLVDYVRIYEPVK